MDALLPGLLVTLCGLTVLGSLALIYRSLGAALREDAEKAGTSPLRREREALLEKKGVLLESIKDAEQDYAMGKLAEDDFEALKASLREEAKGVLRALEQQIAGKRPQADALLAAQVPALSELAAKDESNPGQGVSQ